MDSCAARFARAGNPWDGPEVRKELTKAAPARGGRRLAPDRPVFREVNVPEISEIRENFELRQMFAALRGGTRTVAPVAGREKCPTIQHYPHQEMPIRPFEAPADPQTATPEPRPRAGREERHQQDLKLARDLELALASVRLRLENYHVHSDEEHIGGSPSPGQSGDPA